MSFIDIFIGVVVFWVIGINANFQIIPSIIASVILCTFLFFQPIELYITHKQQKVETQ